MREKALRLLKSAYGSDKDFRSHQWEAIESVLNRVKTLVVQKTGWGKSVVYFLATKLLRDEGAGVTILISPLLSLMRNQLESAKRLGVHAEIINSDNEERWDEIENDLRNNRIDLLLITPERLSNERFLSVLREMQHSIGMFVVDESHCISDWGHDFRPSYRRIVRIVQGLAPNVPVLATTATANDRVIKDIKEQLGDEIQIFRGPLTRESLCLQVIPLPSQEERLAWLAENLPEMNHSGIIYCATIADCNRVAKWLQQQGIEAYEYHSKLHSNKDENSRLREERESLLMNNEIKALVSTIALGMGFDKPDLGFVIHYQTPMNLVNYYQQIGRAGRGLDQASAILLVGQEDEEIQRHMIESAFPSIVDMREVLAVLEEADGGLSLYEILSSVNQSKGSVDKCLKFLELDQVVTQVRGQNIRFFRTANRWEPDVDRMQQVTSNRLHEWETMKGYTRTQECYMLYISRELNDPFAHACGQCANCTDEFMFPDETTHSLRVEAARFLRGNHMVIHPKKQWPAGGVGNERGRIPPHEQNQAGRALCLYHDSGYGPLVREGKYASRRFADELIEATVELIRNKWQPVPMPTWVTCIPSLRETVLVPSFAQRVADALGIPFRPALVKVQQTLPQKEMENSQHKAANVVDAFQVIGDIPVGPVLLLDDVVDSGWTFTVCGVQLLRAGSGPVYPFALADASRGGAGD